MAYSTNPSILTYTTPFLIERKTESAAEGLSSDCRNLLFRKVFPHSPTNAKAIADYILALKVEVNPVDHYRVDITEKSGILKEHYLRQYAGWSPS